MTTIKINEQIALLRKQKGMTQEELASALGVSNQAVSKWESGQNCPDIQLLPEIAGIFHVSVDELLGYKPVQDSESILLELCQKMESLPQGEDYAFAYSVAAAMHALVMMKYVNRDPDSLPHLDRENAIARAWDGKWGFSCFDAPNLITTMCRGAVFFSKNQDYDVKDIQVRRIAALIRPFGDAKCLKTAFAIQHLTAKSEDCFVTADQISEAANLPEETVQEYLADCLSAYLDSRIEDGQEVYRFGGVHMNIVALLSLCDWR